MKTIYTLQEDIRQHPESVTQTQALTLNMQKPFGLKGAYGLFGSPEWWHSIESGVAPVTVVKGAIVRLYREGMHNEGQAFELKTADGSFFKYSCVANQKRDLQAYSIGKEVELRFMLDPLKSPTARETHSRVVLSVSVGE